MASNSSSIELTSFGRNDGGSSQASAPRRRGLIVANTLWNRLSSQATYRKRFWVSIGVVSLLILVGAVTVLGVLLSKNHNTNDGTMEQPSATESVTSIVTESSALTRSSSSTYPMTTPLSLRTTMTMTISSTSASATTDTEVSPIAPSDQWYSADSSS
jgi:hypothetical protein